MKNIKRIVLTGGPCGGKTSALNAIVKHFKGKANVFCVPEAASILISGGMDYLTKNTSFFKAGETATLKLQLLLEDSFTAMAEAQDGMSIVVCDRGPMDSSTYATPELWQQMMLSAGIDEATIMRRYDAVIHLVTSAKGAEEFYNTTSNALRLEQANEEGMRTARALDEKVMQAWAPHPHHYAVDNSTDFDGKLQRVVNIVETIVGNNSDVTNPVK